MMSWKHLIVFAICVVACYSECVPDPLPSSNADNGNIIVGSLKPINTTSDSIVQLIHFLNEYKYNLTNSNDNLMIVTCIKSAKSQIVAGVRYELNVLFQKTKCVKRDIEYSSLSVPNLFRDSCPVDSSSAEVPTKFSIWLKPWLGFVQVKEIGANDNDNESYDN